MIGRPSALNQTQDAEAEVESVIIQSRSNREGRFRGILDQQKP